MQLRADERRRIYDSKHIVRVRQQVDELERLFASQHADTFGYSPNENARREFICYILSNLIADLAKILGPIKNTADAEHGPAGSDTTEG